MRDLIRRSQALADACPTPTPASRPNGFERFLDNINTVIDSVLGSATKEVQGVVDNPGRTALMFWLQSNPATMLPTTLWSNVQQIAALPETYEALREEWRQDPNRVAGRIFWEVLKFAGGKALGGGRSGVGGPVKPAVTVQTPVPTGPATTIMPKLPAALSSRARPRCRPR